MEKEANMYTGNEEIIISGKGDRKLRRTRFWPKNMC